MFVCAVTCLLFLPILNPQASMVKLSLEQLVHDSDLILVRTEESVRSEMIKGELEATQDKIIVKFPAGKDCDIAWKIEESSDLKQGENILIFFLKRSQINPITGR